MQTLEKIMAVVAGLIAAYILITMMFLAVAVLFKLPI